MTRSGCDAGVCQVQDALLHALELISGIEALLTGHIPEFHASAIMAKRLNSDSVACADAAGSAGTLITKPPVFRLQLVHIRS
jgi:hypothetical protein